MLLSQFVLVISMPAFWHYITINPNILGGKPVVKNTLIPISTILQMIREGMTFDQIIHQYPILTKDDIKAIIDYSLYLLDHKEDLEEIALNGPA